MSTKECRKECDVYADWLKAGEKITSLDAELEAMTKKFNLAVAQDYCTMCGKVLDGYEPKKGASND